MGQAYAGPQLSSSTAVESSAGEAPFKRPAAAPVSRSAAEWAFLRERAREAPSDERAALIDRIKLLIDQYPGSPEAPRAGRLLADLYRAQREAPESLMALLSFLYSFPEDDGAAEAKATFLEWTREDAGGGVRAGLEGLGGGPDISRPLQSRLASLIVRVSSGPSARFLAGPALAASRRFLERFPSYEEMSDVVESQARLYRAAGKREEARLSYEELLGVYPRSRFGPAALLGIADIDVRGHGWWWRVFHKGKWRDLGIRAIGALEDLLRMYPGDVADGASALELEVWIYSKCLHQYESAVAAERRLAKLAPKSPEALAALESAARMAHDRLKNYGLEISVRRQIADEFPRPSVAPAQLLAAAGLYSGELADPKNAQKLLNEVADKYPHGAAARKARKMLKKLREEMKNEK